MLTIWFPLDKMDMLRSEIDVLKKIQHPNVIALVDLFETVKHVYLVTQLATGMRLSAIPAAI